MERLVFAILLTATGAQESQLKGPENTLSVAGSNVTLKCLSPSTNCSGIEWMKYSAGNPMTIFNHQGRISNSLRDRYSVENKFGCYLIIENVQLKDAGRFICRAFTSENTVEITAYLIILETKKCATNGSLDDTVEGDGMRLTCEVTFNETNRTSIGLSWKGVEDAPTAVVNGITISRSYSVVASAPEVPSFTCITSFAVETKEYGVTEIYGLATNIPVVTCETPTVKVLFSVRDVQLSQTISENSPGSFITCKAKGHPSPSVIWQELENDGSWIDIQNQKGDQFSVSNDTCKRYRCVAVNIIRGRAYNATSREFQNYNLDQFTLTTARGSEDRLGIGIGIGLLASTLLGSIVFAILIRLRCLEVHPRRANKPLDGVVQHKEQEINPSSSHQLSVMHPSTHRIGAPLVGEQESAYASLGEDKDTNEYAALELKQKATPKKK